MSYDNFVLFQSVPVRTAFYSFSYHLTELSKSWISLLRKKKLSKYFEVAKFLAVRSIERAQSEIALKGDKNSPLARKYENNLLLFCPSAKSKTAI